ncbi:PaaI family thioesterase [Aeromicrobium duanguangcaii]|uniref:Acyl-coenzyme A thioesterase THEM4 n=1 Tax=Aeromicrobium duanguangcaii TaxID=2968086 RepID=A0ABY5KGI9_9ACTN|nr:PaaI family thioesterase [Aeromicrobium duanguangcaii]MCD9155088.1 PaaI family thioesterase [Aeromicrobium duanguangcaii]UUI68257.1 PaaI family thioesterase [Aeromicrobium duanguangcaii]
MSWEEMFKGDFAADDVRAYGELIENLHGVQNALAALSMDREAIDDLSADLARWCERLEKSTTDEQHQVNGRVAELPVRGHAMLPDLHVTSRTTERVEGTVRFGRWFMGGGMAVHGGAVSLLFDEVLGILASLAAGGITRTAYLHTDYRALTPIDTELQAAAWIDRVEGRKWFVRGEIRHGDTVCAEGEGLFLRLLPEQGLGKRTTD